MNSRDAQLILLACRPGTADLNTAEAIAALDHVKDRIRARAKVVALPWWRKPVLLSAAAAVIILAATVALFWNTQPPDPLPTFRSRMVRNVLRQYAMDIETNSVQAIRTFLAARNA